MPEEAITTQPAVMAFSMDCCSRVSGEVAPSEKLSTRAPLATAKLVPLMTSAVVPDPVPSRTLMGMILIRPG